MKYFIVLALCLAISAAVPLNIIEDEDGEQYLLVPVHRQRRDLKWGASDRGFGVAHKGNVFSNGNHRLDSTVGASKAWGSHGLKPDQFGGRVDYHHNPSGSSAFAGANRTPGWGTDVSAGGRYNIGHGKNWNADATAQYGRHFGGPFGTGKPQVGVGLNVNGRF